MPRKKKIHNKELMELVIKRLLALEIALVTKGAFSETELDSFSKIASKYVSDIINATEQEAKEVAEEKEVERLINNLDKDLN